MRKIRVAYVNTLDYDFSLQQRPNHILNELANRGYEVIWVNKTQVKSDKHITQIKVEQGNKTVAIIPTLDIDLEKVKSMVQIAKVFNSELKVETPKVEQLTKVKENLIVMSDYDAFLKIYTDKIDILFCGCSESYKYVNEINPKYVIYDSLDLFPHNEKDEIKMVDKADVILCTTQELMEYHKTNKPKVLCSNGAFPNLRDIEYKEPKEIQSLKKPIVVFVGALACGQNGWVNYEIIKEIAKRWTLLVVGRFWIVEPQREQELMSLPNFHLLGTKAYKDIHKYYKYADVNILPFKKTQIANYSDPIKIYEGCNMGTITVAKDIPVARRLAQKYPNAVLLANNVEEFIGQVANAMYYKDKTKVKEQCYRLADENSWHSKVDIIEDAIKKQMNRKKTDSKNILFINRVPLTEHGIMAGFEQNGWNTFVIDTQQEIASKDGETQIEIIDKYVKEHDIRHIFWDFNEAYDFKKIYRYCNRNDINFIIWGIEDVPYSTMFIDRAINYCDYYFTTCIEHLSYAKKVYDKDIGYLMFGVNSDYHKSDEKDTDKFPHDIVLVANNYDYPTRVNDFKDFIQPLIDSGYSIGIYGSSAWVDENKEITLIDYPDIYCGAIDNELLPKLYSSAKIGIGLQCNKEGRTQQSMRFAEVMGVGNAVFISPYSQAQENLLGESGKYAFFPKTTEEMIRTVEEILNWSDEKRLNFTKQAREFVYTHHNYKDKAKYVIDILAGGNNE